MEQNITINFSQGLDTKTDPWQLQLGKFLSLVNTIFQKGGQMGKRNGYPFLSQNVPPSSSSYITTLNSNLIAVGDTISAYSANTNEWVTNGVLQPCSLSVLPLIRNSVNQVQTDSATANGLVCCAFTQQYGTVSEQVTNYIYSVEDSVTGQMIVNPTLIPPIAGEIAGSPRVAIIGAYFVVVCPVLIGGGHFLQYFSISIIDPTVISAPQNVFPDTYVPLSSTLYSTPGWDMISNSRTLIVAYNSDAGGQGIHVSTLIEAQIIANDASTVLFSFTDPNYKAYSLSICEDLTPSPNLLYISFYNWDNLTIYTFAIFTNGGAVFAEFPPVAVAVGQQDVSNIASAAINGRATVYYEINGAGFGDGILSVYVNDDGTFLWNGVIVRGLGIASKAFYFRGNIYFLAAYDTPFQPSYFLMNATLEGVDHPVVTAKLAYQNGGGYVFLGLPSVTIIGTTVSFSYLFKQDVQALNTTNSTSQDTTGGIYSQLGINQASITIGTDEITSTEIANNLHLSGGFLSMFDGYFPCEHNFFLFPEQITAVYQELIAVPTGTFANGSYVITVSSAVGIYPGMTASDTTNPGFIPVGAQVQYVDLGASTVTLTEKTTSAGAGDTLSFHGNVWAQPDSTTNTKAYAYIAIYEWTDMKGNTFRSAPSVPIFVSTNAFGTDKVGSVTLQIPYMRITEKLANPPIIVIYRWSVANPAYFQVTSVNAPLLNDVTQDAVTFVDTLPDSQIVGNNLLYTTGGVVPDTNGPASNIMTLFDTRLWMVDAEDPNLLWVSKTVVENTPVEMSSFFTIYVAPNIGTTQSTGPILAIFPMDDKIILFKRNSIFYINGTGPDNLGTTSPGCSLGNYSQPIFITSVVGCNNQDSVMLTPDGLMFQSDKGIWLLNRNLGTEYIGAPVEQYNSSVVMSSQVKPLSNYVLFALNTGEQLMYDYYYKQWGIFEGVKVLSSCIYNDAHTVLTPYGIQQETEGVYIDASNPVVMQFTTSWINLAGIQGYQRFYEFLLLAKYLSPHKLQYQVSYDYNPSVMHSAVISPMNFSASIASPFGVPVPVGAPAPLEQNRIHAKIQLCESFQISIQEIFDATQGTVAGPGFTMSGMTCKIDVKKARYPLKGSQNVG